MSSGVRVNECQSIPSTDNNMAEMPWVPWQSTSEEFWSLPLLPPTYGIMWMKLREAECWSAKIGVGFSDWQRLSLRSLAEVFHIAYHLFLLMGDASYWIWGPSECKAGALSLSQDPSPATADDHFCNGSGWGKCHCNLGHFPSLKFMVGGKKRAVAKYIRDLKISFRTMESKCKGDVTWRKVEDGCLGMRPLLFPPVTGDQSRKQRDPPFLKNLQTVLWEHKNRGSGCLE